MRVSGRLSALAGKCCGKGIFTRMWTLSAFFFGGAFGFSGGLTIFVGPHPLKTKSGRLYSMKIWTKFVIVMFAAFALSSCGGSDDNKGGGSPSGNDGIVGDWVLASYAGSQEMAEKVYIRFNEGGTFALYQNINEAGYTELTGNYNYSGGSLSGAFSSTFSGFRSVWMIPQECKKARPVSIWSESTAPMLRRGPGDGRWKKESPGSCSA